MIVFRRGTALAACALAPQQGLGFHLLKKGGPVSEGFSPEHHVDAADPKASAEDLIDQAEAEAKASGKDLDQGPRIRTVSKVGCVKLDGGKNF